jgi:hypothetical protein
MRIPTRSPSASEPRKKNRHDAGDEYAVERSGAADGEDRRSAPSKLIKIEQISSNEHAEASAHIGESRQRHWFPSGMPSKIGLHSPA